MKEKILKAVEELKANAKKRNFVQSYDLIINLKEFDTRKPENRINEEFMLPNGKGKEAKIIIFSDSLKEGDIDAVVINSKKIEELGKNKREAKKLVRATDFFLAEPSLMPVVGKNLGQILAPRGKMPKVISGDIKPLVEKLKKSVKIRIKDSPVVHCCVGNEEMKNEEIVENIESVIKHLESILPKGKNNIKEILLKLTMSKPVKLEVY